MTKSTMTPEQMFHAQDAYHYAIAAAGGQVDGVETVFREKRTKTRFIIEAWANAKLTGLEGLKRPRGPVDGAALARSIHQLCEQLGVDANTGRALNLPEPACADEDEELAPEPHRCKDVGGYCAHCLS